MNNEYKRGSEWRKWDLHVHTPETKLNNNYKGKNNEEIWEQFCDLIENSNVSVIGITDYFSVDNYFKFIKIFSDKYPKSNKIFFPNIEFRLEVSVNKKAEEVNLHVIFDPKTKNGKIHDFLSKLNTTLKREGAVLSCNNLKDNEFVSASIDYRELKRKLKEVFGHEECYLIIAAANNAGLRPDGKSPRKLAITDEIDKICDAFFGNRKNRDYFLDENRYENDEIAKKKPVLSCSDIHSFSDLKDSLGKRKTSIIDGKENIEKDITWIKSDLTFEGLKQILYEPESRIYIGEDEPRKPINTINNFKLQIPNDATVGVDRFCFVGNNSTFYLSPYFNCFIGGRGTGKSTILNFLGLHSVNSDSSLDFWNKLNPSFESSDQSVFNFEGTEIFEFLAQSEIESFAQDKARFTQAIYDRANSIAGNVLKNFELTIRAKNSELDRFISTVFDFKSLQHQRSLKQKEKRTLEESVKVLSSKDYKIALEKIKKNSSKSNDYEIIKQRAIDLRENLADLIEDIDSENVFTDDSSYYQNAYNKAILKIKEAINILYNDNVKKDEELIAKLQKEINALEKESKGLIEKAGYKSESVEQIKSAPQKIVRLSSELKELDSEIDTIQSFLSSLDDIIKDLSETKLKYEKKISQILDPLQNLLTKQFEENEGEDIKKISLEYYFGLDLAWENCAKEFYDEFQNQYSVDERGADVCQFMVESKDKFKSDSLESILKFLAESNKSNRKYQIFIEEVFRDKLNFEVFRAIRAKHLFNVEANKIIQVKYDEKDVEQASFGQRCTSVIVILLLFGNLPLIIDEPETHLDSSLIANYLVPLIKQNKLDRQIIFATHNANFVINADSEKVFILKTISGKTDITETTIEDLSHRTELLKLEGGRNAFEKRGEKLEIIRWV